MKIYLLLCAITSRHLVDSGSTTCKLADSNCIKNTLEKNFPSLHNPSNNKDYPLIDPYFFELGIINFNRSQTARGTFTVKNMTILGANAVKFDSLETKINGKLATVTTNVSVQQLFASGWFKSDLSVSEFTFVTKGQFNLTMDDIKAQFIINGNLIENGHRFNVSDLEMRPVVKNMKFNVVGIVKNENINKIVNQFVNEAWRNLYLQLINDTKSIWNSIALSLINESFSLIKLN